MSRLAIGIQARLGSTRFPHKVLADIYGKPMIQHVVERARQIDQTAIVAVLVPWGEEWPDLPHLPIVGFPGVAEHDVLSRYWRFAQMTNADEVMRLTGDCPLVNPATCLVLAGLLPGVHYGWTRGRGFDCEVFSRCGLEQAHAHATEPYDREHVTPWMRRELGGTWPAAWQGPVPLSVDTPDDIEAVRAHLCVVESTVHTLNK